MLLKSKEKEVFEIVSKNPIDFARHKVIEEVTELVTELIQKDVKDKPSRYVPENVVKEMADVLIRIRALYTKMVQEGEVDGSALTKAVEEKYDKLIGWKDQYERI